MVTISPQPLVPPTFSLSKAVTMNVNNNTQSLTVFTLTGTVLIKKLWGVLTAKTTLTNCTNVYVDLYDSTASSPISKTTTLTLSGLAVGTTVFKDTALANVLTLLDNAAGVVSEATTPQKSFEFIVEKKTAATTTIRMTYTSTDAPANAVMTWYVEYQPLSSDGALA